MPNPAGKLAIGVDIGATKIASILLSENGEVVDSTQVPTLAAEGLSSVLDRVAEQIGRLVRQSAGRAAGIGIGSPGKVDSTQGVVYDAVNLGWVEVNLTRELYSRMGTALPVWVQKDTNLSALGEYYFGVCRGCGDFVYVSVGSGLGGGILSGGNIILGKDGYAAELGHISIDPAGLPCVCGNYGCAETIASGPGLVRLVKDLTAATCPESDGPVGDGLTPEEIVLAARVGNSIARSALAMVGHALGVVMSACTAILNPACFVIGGGLGAAGFDFFEPAIREEIVRRTIANSRGDLKILRSDMASPAIGAGCLVWHALSGKMPPGNPV